MFEILGKKFKGSRGHLAKFSWRGMEKSSKSQSHVPRQGDRGTGGGVVKKSMTYPRERRCCLQVPPEPSDCGSQMGDLL